MARRARSDAAPPAIVHVEIGCERRCGQWVDAREFDVGVNQLVDAVRRSRSTADVVVRSVETSPCGEGAASCGATTGPDPDGDGAIETYSRLRISLVDLDTDAVAWHVGYWLAYGFGAEDDAEKPPPFRDASYEDRRSEWWE